MKFFKLALTMAMLWIAAATYTNAQVIKQKTSNVNKAKTSSNVEKDTTAPEYYELRCRGGGAVVSGGQGFPGVQQLQLLILEGRTNPATNERMMRMLVNFVPGTERVNPTGSNLQLGQCSWPDRGFRPEEPTQIHQEIVYFGQIKQLQSNMPIDHSATAAERYPDSMNVPEYLKDPNHYWSFSVRYMPPPDEIQGGYFEARSSHSWKPLTINQEIQNPRSKVPAEVKKPMR
jgi:hypothetical protein